MKRNMGTCIICGGLHPEDISGIPWLQELRDTACRIYLEFRTSNGETYGEITRRFSEARQAYEEALKVSLHQAIVRGVSPEFFPSPSP